MQKIIPHLWYDRQAPEAAEFYVSVFDQNSKVTAKSVLKGTPSGDTEIVSFTIWGYEFQAISAGPLFRFNPSISFMINFDPSQDKDAKDRVDEIWNKLMVGGKALMPIDKYPFSKRYGWVEDKYGLSWQLILTDPEGDERPLIIPSFLFVTDKCEGAEEATDFYLSVFRDSKRGAIARYPAGMEPNREGSIMFTDFKLENQWFAAMDGSTKMHHFAFNETVSLLVRCDTQREIDYYWSKLSAIPEAEQCGWLKDKYGVSWQIVPAELSDMIQWGNEEQIIRVTNAFLKMKKFDLARLQEAYQGK